MVESGQPQNGPLAGLRVLDISSFIAAPAAAVVLGDWGADVIKIEGPDGDPNRRIMHDSSNYPKAEVNYPWQMDSRNKRSIVLDLKQPPARAALDRLIEKADILICNFPPPVRDKLKLAYDDVKKVNPKLIYASLTGYGESGPDRDRPGFDATAYFARSGLLDAQRYEGGSTLFGRWELAALCQTAARLARAMVAGEPVDPGPPTEDLTRHHRTTPRPGVPDEPVGGRSFGDVLVPPRTAYRTGERVAVTFVGAHLANDLHRGGTFLEVQVRRGDTWVRTCDDGDWSTRIRWEREGRAGSKVTVTWDVPDGTGPGTYRIVLHGDALETSGTVQPFTGCSPDFTVTPADPA